MDNGQKQVLEWHKKFGVPFMLTPGLPAIERRNLRVELIREELEELRQAFENNDLEGVADALADIRYVTDGAGVECGIDLDHVGNEVHRSNMSKVWPDGTVHYREDGKVLKPITYSPADIRTALLTQGPLI